MLTILLVSTADTELLAAAASGAGYLTANPARVTADEVPALAARADLVVLRLLGGRNAWAEGVAALVAADKPLVALGGEAAPDADLMALSTVPAGVATEALAYLREGGPENLRELARFLSDTIFLTGEGFSPPHPMPPQGLHPLPDSMIVASSGHIAPHSGHDHENAPVVAVVFYRAHELSGNTASSSPRKPPGSLKVSDLPGALRMMKSGEVAVNGTKTTDTWAAVIPGVLKMI